jgi:hypothetical protein
MSPGIREQKVKRNVTVAPERGVPFTPTTAQSMIGLETGLNLRPRSVSGRIVDATLMADGNIELIVEVDAGEGQVEFLDGFELRVCRAWSS